MLVYKHDMHFLGGGGVIFVMSRRDFGSYFKSTPFRPRTTQKDLKLKDWSRHLLVQSIGVKLPKYYQNRHFKETLNILTKRV